MKALTTTALIAASLISASAYAGQGSSQAANDFPPPPISTTHELTRAQVLAELAQAKANGGIEYGHEGFPDQARSQAERPMDRAQVVEELKRFEAAHRAGGPGEYPANL
ncbi:MAG: DUF4148 domain-containing protein [Pigmentiphaga sp.]|uniref:DUF4148 domain-containing protein n=1 Tax=Pigmentiphaga sp. TaxID=1977564 RepID=UPI0029BD6596|nr:DUF4148 domain-containing protein [Pigmentiphaga sp.]MDX3908079.1 DUF4148 domain-containing protein [Pigmentiphaga sp.]